MSLEISETTEFAWRRARPLVLAALIGVAAGLCAAAMEWGLHDGTELLIGRFMPKDLGDLGQFRWGVLLLPALGGLLSGLMLRWICPEAKGHGTEALTRSFHHDRGVMPIRGPATYAASSVVVISSGGSAGPEGPVAALGAALGSSLARVFRVVKCWATSTTVGSGAAGGLLGPSLFLGGVTGALVGAVFEALMPGWFPEDLRRALIPVGMGGVLAASMRVPLAAVVMVAEMTGSYRLIVPLMLVCAAAYVIGRRGGLNREQVPTAAQSPVHAADAVIRILESSRVRDFLEPDWPYVLAPHTPLCDIARLIQPGAQPIFAVVEGGRLCGVVTLPGLERSALDRQLAQTVLAVDIMTEGVPTLAPDDDLYHALEIFRHGNLHVLPVVADQDGGRWLGMLTRARVFDATAKRIESSRKAILEEYQGLLAMDQEARLDNLLAAVSPQGDAPIQRLLVPLDTLGKSIRQCGFRSRFGVQIVAVELADGTVQMPPDLDRPLRETDRLLTLRDDSAGARP